jgi:4-hydroxybenzoate polyprenyltransferase
VLLLLLLLLLAVVLLLVGWWVGRVRQVWLVGLLPCAFRWLWPCRNHKHN